VLELRTRIAAASGDWAFLTLFWCFQIIAEILIFIEGHAPNAGNSA
jgi:hypothetical protein